MQRLGVARIIRTLAKQDAIEKHRRLATNATTRMVTPTPIHRITENRAAKLIVSRLISHTNAKANIAA